MVERGLGVSSWNESRRDYVFDVRTAAAPTPLRTEERPGILEQSAKGYEFAKRVTDIILAGMATILLSPLLLLLAIAIRLDSSGPAIIHQQRIGRHGKPFTFYKFRSMTWRDRSQDAREFARQYLNGNVSQANAKSLFKSPAEASEITRVGRFIRKYSLDEVPQLFNVLKGDMSLVGPRPNMFYELEYYSDWHKLRLAATPGLTGWAQIHGRSHLPFDEIVRLDVEYLEGRSLIQDVKIMLLTLPALLKGEGAG